VPINKYVYKEICFLLEYLGPEFIKQMLELIESERENEISDKILTLLLSYNLQFKPHSSANITVDALKDMDCAKTFTEKLLLLINREGKLFYIYSDL
jgi:hypothetical protein